MVLVNVIAQGDMTDPEEAQRYAATLLALFAGLDIDLLLAARAAAAAGYYTDYPLEVTEQP